ncbi:peroxisome membrane protein [Phycomyces blakesleeanus]|uniref:Peroxisomal membrane protein PEX16 n=1 Tax=Phycomyces blakesleeanus TaxID=4837 RepID=A0ABR3BFV2_PHYBL
MMILDKYEDFLVKNASQITSIESSLRSLTYILPGRFQDAEFASQAIYAALHLIGLHHNTILRRAARQHAQETHTQLTEETKFNKYFLYWTNRSEIYKRTSALLSVIQYTQVLTEMAVMKQWGKKAQWRWIASVESLKAILKLIVLHVTSHRMNLSPTHLQRNVDPATLVPTIAPKEPTTWTAKRTGKQVPGIASTVSLDPKTQKKYTDVTDYLLSKVLTPEKLRKPEDMVHTLSPLGRLGEILAILRPLIYVFSILRFGKRSWTPWILSLLAEIGSQLALYKSFNTDGNPSMMPLEKQEFYRRIRAMWYNLLRGAFYTPRFERFCNSVENKTLMSIPGSILRDYLPLWEKIYFYTSSS